MPEIEFADKLYITLYTQTLKISDCEQSIFSFLTKHK